MFIAGSSQVQAQGTHNERLLPVLNVDQHVKVWHDDLLIAAPHDISGDIPTVLAWIVRPGSCDTS